MSKVLQLRGAAAITEMLDMIGATNMPDSDHTVAGILVDHEMDIRELLSFALAKLAAQ